LAVDSGAGSATGARVVSRPRPKRKPKNPIVEIVKIVAGGVGGIAIALLILFWFPVKKYRKDPFEIGPKIGRITWLRFIVPRDYWPADEQYPDEPDPRMRPANGAASGRETLDQNLGVSPSFGPFGALEDSPIHRAMQGRSDSADDLKIELRDPGSDPAKPDSKKADAPKPDAPKRATGTSDPPKPDDGESPAKPADPAEPAEPVKPAPPSGGSST
jgi:hypothetical protein